MKAMGFVESSIMRRASPAVPSPKLPVFFQSAFPTRLPLRIALFPLLSFVHSHRRYAGGPVPRLVSLASKTALDTRGRYR